MAVVVTFADTPKALMILAPRHDVRPELPVIVRTYDDSDVGKLKEAAPRRSSPKWSRGR